MIELKRIESATNPLWHAFATLYEETFPEAERIPLAYQREKLTDPTFHTFAIVFDGEFAGLCQYIDIKDFSYISYLATLPQRRNAGIGRRVMQLLFETDREFILDIEIPGDDPLKMRRKRFYESLGFQDCHYRYAWNFSESGESVELEFVSYPRRFTHEECAELEKYFAECARLQNPTLKR